MKIEKYCLLYVFLNSSIFSFGFTNLLTLASLLSIMCISYKIIKSHNLIVTGQIIPVRGREREAIPGEPVGDRGCEGRCVGP